MSPGCLSVSKVAGTALRSGSCWKRTFRPFVKHWRSISIITVEILIFWLFLALPTLLTPQAHQFPQQDSPARPPPQSPQSPAPRAPLATRPTRTQRTHINAHPKIASRACSLPTQPRRTHHTPTRAPPQGAAAGPAEGGVPRVSSAHLLGEPESSQVKSSQLSSPSRCASFWPSPCPSSRAQAQARARPSPCPSSRAQAQARARAWNAVVSRHWTTPRQTPVQYASGHCSARATNGKQMVGRGPGVQWRGSQSGTCGGRVSGGLQRGGRGGKANAWAHRQACGDAVGTQRGLSAPAHLRRGELVLALCRRQLFAAPEGRGTTRG